MSNTLSASVDLAQEKLYTAAKKTQQKQQAEQHAVQEKINGIIVPDVEDLAMITTTVPMNEKSVLAPTYEKVLFNYIKVGVNMAALEEAYKETFKKSKSHNLLLERFTSIIKMGGISMMMGLCGVDPEKLEQIKARVREEALAEIDIKLSQDWAYAKAMLDIVG